MTLPVFRRFTLQDIPNAPNWMTNVLTPLNLFCETTVSSLNKNLTIGTNVQGQKFSTSFVTPTDYMAGGFPTVQFAYTGGGQPNCLLLGSIAKADGTQLLSAVSINDWFLNINTSPFQVTVNYIAGLSASTKYNVTFLVI